MAIKWECRVNFKTLGTSSSSVPLIVKAISESLILEGRRMPVMSIALVLPLLIGSLLEAGHSTISAIEKFKFCSNLSCNSVAQEVNVVSLLY